MIDKHKVVRWVVSTNFPLLLSCSTSSSIVLD